MEFNEVLGRIDNAHTPWRDCQKVLLPVNVDGDHWVALALNFHEQKLHVYNSLRGPTIRGQLCPITKMLPMLLKAVGFYEQKKPKRELREDEGWAIEVQPTPKQKG